MSWLGGTAHSVAAPSHTNTPLLVAFNKTRFPAYAVCKRVDLFSNGGSASASGGGDSGGGGGGGCGSDSRLMFMQWEASNELRHIYENVSLNILCVL